MLILARFPLLLFEDFAYIAYIGVVVLLIGVELLGFVGGGSQRWLDLGIVNLQPSELMKIATVLALAPSSAQIPPGNPPTWPALWPAPGLNGVPAGPVLLPPALGPPLATRPTAAAVPSPSARPP